MLHGPESISTMFNFPGIVPVPLDFLLDDPMDVPLLGQMSVSFLFLCVGVLNSGGFMRTTVNCSSDLCRVNPDSKLDYLSNLSFLLHD